MIAAVLQDYKVARIAGQRFGKGSVQKVPDEWNFQFKLTTGSLPGPAAELAPLRTN